MKCDRCGHDWKQHNRRVPSSHHACSAQFGVDHQGKKVTCPCDGFFPDRREQ